MAQKKSIVERRIRLFSFSGKNAQTSLLKLPTIPKLRWVPRKTPSRNKAGILHPQPPVGLRLVSFKVFDQNDSIKVRNFSNSTEVKVVSLKMFRMPFESRFLKLSIVLVCINPLISIAAICHRLIPYVAFPSIRRGKKKIR